MIILEGADQTMMVGRCATFCTTSVDYTKL